MLTVRFCPVCGSEKFLTIKNVASGKFNRVYQDIHFADITRCCTCGVDFTNPVLTDELDQEQYTHPECGYNKRKIKAISDVYWTDQAISLEILKAVESNRSIKVLDFACGKGGFVYLAGMAGYTSVKGIDLNPKGIMQGKMLGIKNLVCSNVNAEPEGRYDVVVALHVLEHCTDCQAVAHALVRVLKPGGKLIVAVPNAKSVSMLLKPNKYWNSPYAHMNALDYGALKRIFVAANLRPIPLAGDFSCFDWKNRISMNATKILGNQFGFYPTKLFSLFEK